MAIRTKYPPPEDFSPGWMEREQFWADHPEQSPLQHFYDEWEEEQEKIRQGVHRVEMGTRTPEERRTENKEVRCTRCGVRKDTSEGTFHRDDSRMTGWRAWCKECVKKGKSG